MRVNSKKGAKYFDSEIKCIEVEGYPVGCGNVNWRLGYYLTILEKNFKEGAKLEKPIKRNIRILEDKD